MKKLLYFIVPILVLIFAVSCSKSDDGNDNSGYFNVSVEGLNNTTWASNVPSGVSKYDYIGFKGNRIAWARSSGCAYIIDSHYGDYTLNGDKISVVEDETSEHYTFQLRFYKDSKGKLFLVSDPEAVMKDKVPNGFFYKTDTYDFFEAHD